MDYYVIEIDGERTGQYDSFQDAAIELEGMGFVEWDGTFTKGDATADIRRIRATGNDSLLHERKQGVITNLIKHRKYGFITWNNNDNIFFHSEGVITPNFQELKEGMTVEFYEILTPRGFKAIGIKSLD